VRIDETTEPENDAEEAIVEEMVARSAEETEIPTTQDRDDQTDSDDGEGDEA
jgi:DNA gyrase subunit A